LKTRKGLIENRKERRKLKKKKEIEKKEGISKKRIEPPSSLWVDAVGDARVEVDDDQQGAAIETIGC
jgi:hypothetical protein